MVNRSHRLFLPLLLLIAPVTRADDPALRPTLPRIEVRESRPGASGWDWRREAGSGSATLRPLNAVGPRLGWNESLGLLPGVWTASAQGGELAKLSVRGSGIQSDETLGVQVLLDGLAYNQGDGEANLEELDPDALDAVHVHRGAQTLSHTGFVLGGAIDLRSKTGRTAPGPAARAVGGSFGYRRVQANAGGVRGAWDGFASVATRRLDGFREHGAETVTTLHANLGFAGSPAVENRLYLAFADWRREIAGTLTADEARADPRQAAMEAEEGDFRVETRSWRVADQVRWRQPDQQIVAGAFFHRRDFLLVDEYEQEFRLGVTDAYSHNLGVRFAWERELVAAGRAHSVSAGWFGIHETEVSENFRSVGGRPDRTHQTAAGETRGLNLPLFIESRIALSDQLAVELGLQYVRITRRYEDRFFSDEAGDASARQTFSALNPKVGFVYTETAERKWFGNVTRSFQPPSFDDLNPFAEGENGSVVYHPLDAQRAWTVELGHRAAVAGGTWEVTAYHAELRNELLELNDATGRDLGTVNVPRTRHRGIEAGWELPLTPAAGIDGWYWTTSYTLNDFHFADHPVYATNRIAGVPIHLLGAELEYRADHGWHGAAWLESSLSRYPADQSNTLEVDDYLVLGLRLGWRSRGGWAVFVEARNLTDERYVAMVEPMADARTADAEERRIFSPGAGRAFYLGISWQG